jgi:acetyl-CoA carboxylase biotin carboxyl carrier protein
MAMDYKEIQELIKLIGKTNIGELKLKDGDFEIQLRTNEFAATYRSKGITTVATPMAPAVSMPQAPAPVAAPAAAPTPAAKTETAPATSEQYTTIKSPMIGTFYRSPSPDKDPYIKVGDSIQQGDVICIIEAMKLFNEIESEFSGKIVKVLVEDSSPVEYDQPLFLIDTNA